jgi:hypothetical protein
MLRKSVLSKPTAQQLEAANPLLAFKDPIKVSSRGVRDAIIAKLLELAPQAAFTKPLIDHLKQMGSDKLDTYNKIDISLQEYYLGLHFFTSLVGGDELVYTFPANPGPPPDELKRTKFLGLF